MKMDDTVDAPRLDVKPFSRRASTPALSDDPRMATIKIPSGQEFHVHAHLLVQFSDYFLQAFNSSCEEAITMSFELHEHAGQEQLRIMIEWLYGQTFTQFNSQNSIKNFRPTESDNTKWYSTLVKTWLFADYLQMPLLQNVVMSSLINSYVWAPRANSQQSESSEVIKKLTALSCPQPQPLREFHLQVLALHLFSQAYHMDGRPNYRTLELLQAVPDDTQAELSLRLLVIVASHSSERALHDYIRKISSSDCMVDTSNFGH